MHLRPETPNAPSLPTKLCEVLGSFAARPLMLFRELIRFFGGWVGGRGTMTNDVDALVDMYKRCCGFG